jgi:hypothetical protein
MAGQWFALPKLFKSSENKGYEIVKNDKDLIQFKNEQSWTFKIIPRVSLRFPRLSSLASIAYNLKLLRLTL